MSITFDEKISSCVNVVIQLFDGDGKQVSKRRMQYKCEMPEQCRDDAEREAAMMQGQANLKTRTSDEWVQLLEEHFGDNPKLQAAVASVVFWDYYTDTRGRIWEIANSAGRKVLSVPCADINAGLKLLGYVKPAYRAMTLRRMLTKLDKIKVVGSKVVVTDK